jgi:hypothetical protein
VHGHPIVVVRTAHFDPKARRLEDSTRQLVQVLEAGMAAAAAAGRDRVTVIWDNYGAKGTNLDAEFFKAGAKLLQSHYPGRLHAVLAFPCSKMLKSGWPVLKRLLDKDVQARTHLLRSREELARFVPRGQLPRRLGGLNRDV